MARAYILVLKRTTFKLSSNDILSMLTKSCKLQQNQKDKKKLTAGRKRQYKSQLESKVAQQMSRELTLALTDSSASVSETTISKTVLTLGPLIATKPQ